MVNRFDRIMNNCECNSFDDVDDIAQDAFKFIEKLLKELENLHETAQNREKYKRFKFSTNSKRFTYWRIVSECKSTVQCLHADFSPLGGLKIETYKKAQKDKAEADYKEELNHYNMTNECKRSCKKAR